MLKSQLAFPSSVKPSPTQAGTASSLGAPRGSALSPRGPACELPGSREGHVSYIQHSQGVKEACRMAWEGGWICLTREMMARL